MQFPLTAARPAQGLAAWSSGGCMGAWVGQCMAISLASVSLAMGQTTLLHQRIDEQIAQDHIGPLSPISSDTDFVRRVYLDLLGMIPSAAEARAFLADASADKRIRLIDQLLADPRHARHMANAFDVMLMERRADKHVPAGEWQQYLMASFLANKPYDVLVREILSAEGVDPATRPAARFSLDRNAEPNLMARDVGRIFFGRDLQCAQCHDHPLIDDYFQADYYGLYAFFSRTQLFTFPDKDKQVVLMDNAAGEVSFQSVFDPAAVGNTLPRVPGGKQVEEPRFPPGEEWVVAPAKETRHVPKYSRRAQLAGQVAVPANRQFNRNIVNRIWAQFMGIGLVEPVDLHHLGNPPTHPRLLEMLADDIVAMQYDIRAFVRELVLSQTYQRSIDLPGDLVAQATAATAAIAAIEAQQLRSAAAAQASQAVYATVAANLATARRAIPPIAEELSRGAAQVPDAQKAIDVASKALADAREQLAPKLDVAKAVLEAATKAREAAARLPAEKDLTEAAAKFQSRADQLNAEVAPLASTVEEKAAALKAAEDKLAAIQQMLAEIHARLDAARKPVIALEEECELAAARCRADRFQDNLAQRRLAEAKLQSQYAVALATVREAQPAIEKLAAELNDGKATVAMPAADLSSSDADQRSALAQSIPALETQLSSLQQKVAGDAQAAQQMVREIPHRWSREFATRPLVPLVPEPLGWSMLRATGVYDNETAAVTAEIDKTAPLPEAARNDPAQLAARQRQIEAGVHAKLAPSVLVFVQLFGPGAGQPQSDFFATADQALFLANGGVVQEWLAPSGENLSARLLKLEDPRQLAEELYLSVLTRLPAEAEVAEITRYLAARPAEKSVVLQELAWSLLSSAEFRFNY